MGVDAGEASESPEGEGSEGYDDVWLDEGDLVIETIELREKGWMEEATPIERRKGVAEREIHLAAAHVLQIVVRWTEVEDVGYGAV